MRKASSLSRHSAWEYSRLSQALPAVLVMFTVTTPGRKVEQNHGPPNSGIFSSSFLARSFSLTGMQWQFTPWRLWWMASRIIGVSRFTPPIMKYDVSGCSAHPSDSSIGTPAIAARSASPVQSMNILAPRASAPFLLSMMTCVRRFPSFTHPLRYECMNMSTPASRTILCAISL